MASGGSMSTHPSEADSVTTRFGRLSTKPSEGESFTDTKPQTYDENDKPNTGPSDGDSSSPSTRPSLDTVHGEHDVLLYSSISKVGNVNVMVSSDKLNSCITDCCFMPGGQLVLYDFGNKKIKLLLNRNKSLFVVGSLAIPGGDWDTSVAAVDNNSVVVTVASKKQIQFIQVLPRFKMGRTFDVDRPCNLVAVAACKIFVLCDSNTKNEVIKVYDLSGRYLGKGHDIDLGRTNAFVFPMYLAVSKSGDKFYVSDRDTHAVSCLSRDGHILFQYKNDELQRPFGLFVDDNDNLIICGDYSHNLQVMTATGEKHKNPLTSKDGITNPTCVGVRPTDGMLVVGSWDNPNIVVFKMS